jgi:hypothetical protein
VLAVVWPNTLGDDDCDDGGCGPPPSVPLDPLDDVGGDTAQSSPYRDAEPRFPEIAKCAGLGPTAGDRCCRFACKYFDSEEEPVCAENSNYSRTCYEACSGLVLSDL